MVCKKHHAVFVVLSIGCRAGPAYTASRMSESFEFQQHTGLLHDNLCTLLGNSAIRIEPAVVVASGLLGNRLDDSGRFFRPRLAIVAGAANLICSLIKQEEVRDDMVAIGTTRQDDVSANMGRVFVACPGVAKDALKRTDLEPGQIVKLSHSILTAEPEPLTSWQAAIYYQKILEKLGQI